MTALRPTALPALGLLAALALAGCTTGGTDDEAPSSAGGSPEESTGLTTDSGGDCLVGEWIIPEDQLQAFYGQVAAESGLTMTVAGDTALDFTATGYRPTRTPLPPPTPPRRLSSLWRRSSPPRARR